MIKSNVRVFGTLITGESIAEKTELIGNIVSLFVEAHPDWKLHIAVSDTQAANLPTQVMLGSRSERHIFPKSSGSNINVQENLLTKITADFAGFQKLLIVVPEAHDFFSDWFVGEKFKALAFNAGAIDESGIRFLFSTTAISDLTKSLGADFSHNFTEYTALRSRVKEKLLSENGLNTEAIKTGFAVRFRREEIIPGKPILRQLPAISIKSCDEKIKSEQSNDELASYSALRFFRI